MITALLLEEHIYNDEIVDFARTRGKVTTADDMEYEETRCMTWRPLGLYWSNEGAAAGICLIDRHSDQGA